MKTTLKTTIATVLFTTLASISTLSLAYTTKHTASKPIQTQDILVKDFTGSYVGSRNFGTIEATDNKTFLTIAPNRVKSVEEINKVVNGCGDVATCHVKAKVLRIPTGNPGQYDYYLIEALEVNKVE
jgi:hypothetical protein